MRGERTERLATQFQQEIAMILQQELKDPSLGFVTITRVELSKDVSHAKVYFSCLGPPEERERSQHALERSARFLHGLLKKRFRLKVIPMLHFHYDASIEKSIEFSTMLERLQPPPRPDGS
ncbi:MAG: 30S ribosome-binding factor RbfA [Candidatus Omnitrophica bacterium]|nr:30S ribosome-binding factor RbfA [Candidatus Omnitrophota bacterium]